MPLTLEIALVCIVIAAAAYDLKYRRIPNWVSLSGIVLGLGCNTLLFGVDGLSRAGLGLLCAALIYIPLYVVRGMGAGDVKLMAAVGAIAGPRGWVEIFLATALIGGILSLAAVTRKHRVRQTLWNVGTILTELLHFRAPAKSDSRLDMHHREAIRLPHAASIAAGSLVFLIHNGSR